MVTLQMWPQAALGSRCDPKFHESVCRLPTKAATKISRESDWAVAQLTSLRANRGHTSDMAAAPVFKVLLVRRPPRIVASLRISHAHLSPSLSRPASHPTKKPTKIHDKSIQHDRLKIYERS